MSGKRRDRWGQTASCLAVLLLLAITGHAQSNEVFTLTANSLQDGKAVELDKRGWKYQPDDDPRFADPQFDDRAWATLTDSAKPQDSPSGWHGIGWFRLHLRVAPELANVALNLEMSHLGASEVYVNGKLIRRFGVVGKTLAEETAYNPNALPLLVVLQTGTEQVIAVRYSNQQAADERSFLARWMRGWDSPSPFGWGGIGFKSRVRVFDAAANQRTMGYGVWPFSFGFQATQATAFLSFGILHLLLFAFLARQRTNLFYGLFLFGIGINTCIGVVLLSAHYGVTAFYLLHGWALSFTWFGSIVSLIGFLHSAFTARLPRRMWLFLAGALLMVLGNTMWQLKSWVILANLLTAVYALEIVRIMVGAIWRQLPGARIVGVGLLLLSLTLAQSFLTTPNVLTYGLGIFGMILALSIYLAREYARTNEHLADQLVQVKQLSAKELEHERREAELTLQHEQEQARRALLEVEHDRKAKELEEARQLQLSLLPKKVPNLPGLEIAAYMKTATEVGGDYYDFHVSEDGTLTIAVGDVLVLLSDGLPERFNANSEMLGDEAAVRVLYEAAQLSPSEIIQRLVQRGDDWGGARPQDDDATFVVVKMK